MTLGRNDPCHCGSGKKYKKCCLPGEEAAIVTETGWLRMRRTEGELIEKMAPHMARHYGPDALDEAWEEYTLWPASPASPGEWPEYDTSFPAWAVFDWEPDQAEADIGVERPSISPARHYADRKGNSLDSYERRYIDAACGAPFTFYLVVSTVPGREMTLRDILRRGEVTVRERQASASLRPGQIVFTKVVEFDGESVMLGCAPYVIPARFFDAIVEMRTRIPGGPDLDAEILRDFHIELRELYLDLRGAVINPAPPVMQNTDGDPLQFTRIEYELDCSAQDAFTALLPLTLENDPDEFTDDIERDAAGELVAVEIPWARAGNAKNPGWSNTLLGRIEIRDRRMTVNVNSQARADTIQAEIAMRLGPGARRTGVEIESIEQMKAAAGSSEERSERDRENERLQRMPEIQAHLAEINAEHWRAWPDIPLPALKGQTPRQAATTPEGRELLDVLLLDFSAHAEVPDALRPDVAALRRELGL